MTPRERRLLEQFHALPPAVQDGLLDYLDFLYRKYEDQRVREAARHVPFARPPEETVVGAMQRLRKTYPDLDVDSILHRASALMSEHVVGGRSAGDVIDDLEELFRRRHEQQRAGRDAHTAADD